MITGDAGRMDAVGFRSCVGRSRERAFAQRKKQRRANVASHAVLKNEKRTSSCRLIQRFQCGAIRVGDAPSGSLPYAAQRS